MVIAMDKALEKITAKLASAFGGTRKEFRGQVSVTIAPEKIIQVGKAMRDTHGFEMLVKTLIT